MADLSDKINELLSRLELLMKKQESFSREISQLEDELTRLRRIIPNSGPVKKEQNGDRELAEMSDGPTEEIKPGQPPYSDSKSTSIPRITTPRSKRQRFRLKVNLEKFIGENLINKIGIIITVIGVAIGAKYSIDNNLISPLTRIILGYTMGIVLLGFGIKLKKNYINYSAVLVSGAIAILYFITYFAYSFYSLIPQTITFALMVIFTSFGVITALNYSKQVIAVIGLVGAYAVPFLLGDESGNIAVLFGYTALINGGILVIAVQKYWKSLYYSAFILTWLIYSYWHTLDYNPDSDFNLALTFLFIFFAIFYMTFLAYKLVKKQNFGKIDVGLILTNSFVFYGFGYSIFSDNINADELVGLFTLGNALIHFIVSIVIYRQQLADRNLFFFISGLVLVFITIAVPVQLDGNWVTLLWAGEAALLFWIGRTRGISFYESLSYPIMILAFISLNMDWLLAYEAYQPDTTDTKVTPVFNVTFLSSILFCGSFGWINYLNYHKKYPSPIVSGKGIIKLMSLVIPGILLWALYYTFRIEIEIYWNQLYLDSELSITPEGKDYAEFHSNINLVHLKIVWVLNYTLLFLSVLSFVNIKWLRHKILGNINVALNIISIVTVLTLGIATLSNLRSNFINKSLTEYYSDGPFQMGIRYLSFSLVALLLFLSFRYLRKEFVNRKFSWGFDLILHGTILWIASSELIHWMDIAKSSQPDKIGLSILWGIYSLLLIILGIWKKKKHLRIGAIILFSVTLIKLFAYDIADLDTIAKTIVFVSLGILLLIISFLYNKYKHMIYDEETAG